MNTPAVANLIRQGKLDQLENAMQSGAAFGMRLMDTRHPGIAGQGRSSAAKHAYQEGHQQGEVRAVQGHGLKPGRPNLALLRSRRRTMQKGTLASDAARPSPLRGIISRPLPLAAPR